MVKNTVSRDWKNYDWLLKMVRPAIANFRDGYKQNVNGVHRNHTVATCSVSITKFLPLLLLRTVILWRFAFK